MFYKWAMYNAPIYNTENRPIFMFHFIFNTSQVSLNHITTPYSNIIYHTPIYFYKKFVMLVVLLLLCNNKYNTI